MVWSKVKTYGELVMFSHTIFSLPFALIGMFWAAEGLPKASTIFWILVALAGARNGANALNRLVDRKIDAKNPRTAGRHLPQGIVKPYEVWIIVIFCFGIFVYAAYRLNPLCLALTPAALLLFFVYSYTKRFTFLCHIVLGIACGGAPVGAWLAVTGSFALPPFILGAVVMLWVAGFDILYGTQDIEFDRANGLFSMPSYFGLKRSLQIAAFMHLLMVGLLISLFFIMHTSWIYLVGILISTGLLLLEHQIVAPQNEKIMKFVSYHINQLVSPIILLFVLLDLYVG